MIRSRALWLSCLVLVSSFGFRASGFAATVQLFDGTVLDGTLSFDNGLVVRGATAVKLGFTDILCAKFADAKAEEYQPGLVLVSGARIAGPFTSLADTSVKAGHRNLTIPGGEIAWAIYQPFAADIAAQIPRGKIGALLPGGDFFEGTAKSADSNTAKVVNTIFGPRTFDAKRKELHALILREIKTQPAGFEVVTADGSIFPALDIVARDATGITLRHALYDGMKIETKDIVEIRAGSSRYTALDSIKPTRTDGSTQPAFAAGKMLDGTPLKLGDKTVHGFETAAGAAITWDIPIASASFVARVAAGPTTPAGQKITFAIYADGRPVARSAPVAVGDAPAILRCQLTAISKLSLRAESPTGTGIWAEPILYRR